MQAEIILNIFSIVGLVFGVTWLVVWGIDLIFDNEMWPKLKLTTIFFGYAGILVKVYFDSRSIERRIKLHNIKRELRARKNT